MVIEGAATQTKTNSESQRRREKNISVKLSKQIYWKGKYMRNRTQILIIFGLITDDGKRQRRRKERRMRERGKSKYQK